jgi:hypothetical protein
LDILLTIPALRAHQPLPIFLSYGHDNAVLTLRNVTAPLAGNYRVVVSNFIDTAVAEAQDVDAFSPAGRYGVARCENFGGFGVMVDSIAHRFVATTTIVAVAGQ